MEQKMALLSDNDWSEGLDHVSTSLKPDLSAVESTRTIVVASISESIRGMVAWILEDAGYNCIQASDKSELNAVLESKAVMLGIIDAGSPEFEIPPVISSEPPRLILLLENGQIPRESWKYSNVFSIVLKPFSAGQILSSVASAFPDSRAIL